MSSPENNPFGLAVSGLGHSFGSRRVLDGIDLQVDPGEILCVVGPSGCGKTTALRLIAGLEDLQAGEIRWQDTLLANKRYSVPPEDRGVSLLFQDFALFPHLTVAENVAFGLRGLDRRERDLRVHRALEQVEMLAYADSYPHVLSGGEQQRIALARARAPQPRTILLDEPFSSLDAQLRGQVRDLSLHLLKAGGAAAVVVTHDPEEAMFMADRILAMRDGRVVQTGTPEDIYFRPSNPFVAALFGEMNEFAGQVVEGHVQTPIGQLCSPGFRDGTRVKVLVRPEALTIVSGSAASAHGRVIAARLLGRTSLIHLSVDCKNGGESLHLHSRVAGRMLPHEGETIGLRLDTQNVFVFPESEGTSGSAIPS